MHSHHDPFVPVIRPTREHAHWAGTQSTPWTESAIRWVDLVLISTAHPGVDSVRLVEGASQIVDTRNALAGIPSRPGQVWKT